MDPFQEKMDEKNKDNELVRKALTGDQESLEKLILRHQGWIYNIAFRMVLNRSDAEDITQEILIKVISRLSGYDRNKAAFRTWLYRIVVNHVINMKNGRAEITVTHFDDFALAIENIPDNNLDDTPDKELLIEESKIGCMTAMLLCLTRKQRIVFILGEIFTLHDKLGSEILEITRENFRKRLSRARKRLYNFMNRKCGLLNRNNPCRCANKAKGFIDTGWVDPNNIVYYQGKLQKVKDIISEKSRYFNESYYLQYNKLYREHPFYKSPDFVNWFRKIIQNNKFKDIFHLQ